MKIRGYTKEAKASITARIRAEAADEAAGRCTLCRLDPTEERSAGKASCSLTGCIPWGERKSCPALRAEG